VSGPPLADRWLEKAQAHLARLRAEALPEVIAAAELTAERVAAGGAIHHLDTGHTAREPIRRAGGLAALHGIEPSWTLRHDPPPGREEKGLRRDYFYDVEAMGRLVIERSHVARGDVLWLVSNSGKEPFPVEAALRSKALGCAVVAVTSVAFSRSLAAAHSSGKRLFEVADRVVDTRGPNGDAALEVPGVDAPVGPMSGLLSVAAVWALTAATVEALLRRGIAPSILRSVNLPGGFEHDAAAERRVRERGI
jgi:uncharacterized phosphosugar-binding protein